MTGHAVIEKQSTGWLCRWYCKHHTVLPQAYIIIIIITVATIFRFSVIKH